jgi:hypothetical protein
MLEKICAQDACLEEIMFTFMRTKMRCFCDKFQEGMMPPFASTVKFLFTVKATTNLGKSSITITVDEVDNVAAAVL